MSVIRKLFSGLEKKYVLFIFFLLFSIMGWAASETCIPLMIARIINSGVIIHNKNSLLRYGFLCVVVVLFILFLRFVRFYLTTVISENLFCTFRKKIVESIFLFSFEPSNLRCQLRIDAVNARQLFFLFFDTCVPVFFLITGSVIMSLIMIDKFSFILLMIIPVLIFIIFLLIIIPRIRNVEDKKEIFLTVLKENIAALKIIKASNCCGYEDKKFAGLSESVRSEQLKTGKIELMCLIFIELLFSLSFFCGIWIGGAMVINNTILVGDLIAFCIYFIEISLALKTTFPAIVLCFRLKKSIIALIETMCDYNNAFSPELYKKGNVSSLFHVVRDGSVVLSHVSYQDRTGEKKIDFSDSEIVIRNGQTVVFLDVTGHSQLILMELLLRFLDPAAGSIQIGGIDVRLYDFKSLRDAITVTFQENSMFFGTVKNNLLRYKQTATQNELVAVCTAVGLNNFISSLPDGYETMIGEHGICLNKDQKFQLCIAQALLRKSKILVIDKLNLDIDPVIYRQIKKTLRLVLPETTILIFNNSISAVDCSDTVILLDNGKIIGRGTHKQLCLNNLIYREIDDFLCKTKGV